MEKKELPKAGDRIPAEKFYVSKMNVRAGEEFGVGDKDEALKMHLSTDEIVQPFIARLEDKDGRWDHGMDPSLAVGYGVVVGRRRFLARRERVTHFVVGQDVLVRILSDQEALDISLKENLDIFRKDLDPITRGDRLAELFSKSTRSLRDWARKWSVSRSTLSDWIVITELSPKMREAIQKGLVPFFDGLQVHRLNLGVELQEELGGVALADGLDAFRRELARLTAGRGKRGVPRGLYELSRLMWDKRNPKIMACYQILSRVAEAKKMRVPDYIMDYIMRHIDEIAKEA